MAFFFAPRCFETGELILPIFPATVLEIKPESVLPPTRTHDVSNLYTARGHALIGTTLGNVDSQSCDKVMGNKLIGTLANNKTAFGTVGARSAVL
jgi:hypothetical protein